MMKRCTVNKLAALFHTSMDKQMSAPKIQSVWNFSSIGELPQAPE